jgi:hypothetical protein
MDLRIYYQKIREVESKIEAEFPVVKSRETADGGKGGTLTEVSRNTAAKLIVDGVAELASGDEMEQFREQVEAAKKTVDSHLAAVAAQRLTLIPQQEIDYLRANQRAPKD